MDAAREAPGRAMASRRRPAGAGPSQSSDRASALEQIRNLRQKNGKRVDAFNLKLEEKVYDEVSEPDYALLVAHRREEAKGFVVDDGDLGYADIGEEEEWDVNVYSDSEGDEADARSKKPRQRKDGDPKKKEVVSKAAAASAAAAALNKQRVSTMFAAASGPSSKAKEDWRAADSENVLEDVLAEIGVDTVDREKEKRRRLGMRGQAAARIGQQGAGQQRPARESALLTVPSLAARKPIRESRGEDEEGYHVVGDRGQESCGIDEAELPAQPDSPPTVPKQEQVPEVDELSSIPEPVPVVPVLPVEGNKVGLNAKVASAAPAAPAASAAWQAIREGGVGEKLEVVGEKEQVEIAPADIADFPLDADGRLPFYLIDAHEEGFGANPGTVYLFGKVLFGGQYVSCCVVVGNIQRCIYAIPAPSVFPATELALLQGAAQSDGKADAVALTAKLQELAGDVKDEIAQKLLDLQVGKFTMVPVKRSYAFERPDVTSGEHYFIKLSYPFKDTVLPADLKGTTFSGLFGTQTSALELLLIKKKIKGPCWLSIANPVLRSSPSQVSWCKLEVVVDSPKNLTVAVSDTISQQIPTLVVAAINLKTVVNHKQNVNEVAAASVVYCRQVQVDVPMLSTHWNTHKMLNHFSVVRKLDGGIFPLGFTSEVTSTNAKAGSNVLSCEGSERALLNNLMIKLHQLDADILVGHNISGFDLDVLLHRLQACKVPSSMWSKIGRLKRSVMPKLSGGGNTFGAGAGPGAMACIAGRLLCDTYLAARDLVKEVSYSLTQLSKSQLGRERKELIPSEIPSMYKTSATLFELVESGETDAWLSLSLMFHLNVLPLTRQLTNISGNLWGKTLQGARAQRVEYLLLHEFHSRKFIVPDKLTLREKERIALKRKKLSSLEVDDGEELVFGDHVQEETPVGPPGKRKKGPAYSGGLVLEPKKGLYDKYILLLDFNSLYPSIIQEYNVCFTTVERSDEDSIPALPTCDTPGVLPQVLKSLVERRKQVKQWLKRTSDNLKYQQLDIQQQALKLTANSMYGCLGFPNSRFYAKPIAELITSQGREILQSTVDLVQNTLNFEVIYGDTDSIMIHTGLDDPVAARDIGVKVIKEVNKKYRLLEIDMDGLYKRMLLLKKKKYAAVKVVPTGDGTFREVIEQKGLDIVRRDWSMLSKEIGNFCLEQILSGGLREEVVESIHNQLRKLQEEMRSGQVELDKYIITKTLTKNPEEYPDARNQPHVQVALRRRLSGHRIGCFVGDTVPYIVCVEQGSGGGSSSGIADRARHPDELKQDSGNWIVDIDYYIQQQIHPVVMRLCAPIEGTDSGRLADCLGLDPLKFQQRHSSSTNDRDDALVSSGAILDDDDRYRTCEPLQLICPCSQRFDFAGVDSIIAAASQRSGSAESSSPHPESPFRCPRCRHHGGADTEASARLANQVKQRAEDFVTRYYEGWMMCDEEICGHMTRNITLRVSGDADRGTVCPNYPRCNGHLTRQYTEADLYKQLTHFCRLLDIPRAMDKIEDEEAQTAVKAQLSTVLDALVDAADTMVSIRDRCAYRWVQMDALCVSSN